MLLFAQNPEKLVTREAVRNAIWDSAGEYVSDNTLNVYIKRLRDKVEPTRRTRGSSKPCAGWGTRREHSTPRRAGIDRAKEDPMRLTRNPSFLRQAGTMAAVLAAVVAAACIVDGGRCALWAAGAGLAMGTLFAVFSEMRFRQVMRLASEVDEVQHEGRRIDFSDYARATWPS